MFANQDPKRNRMLHEQQRAHLAETVEAGQAAAAMRELTVKDRKHRLHALLWALTGWRTRRRGTAVPGDRSWDH